MEPEPELSKEQRERNNAFVAALVAHMNKNKNAGAQPGKSSPLVAPPPEYVDAKDVDFSGLIPRAKNLPFGAPFYTFKDGEVMTVGSVGTSNSMLSKLSNFNPYGLEAPVTMYTRAVYCHQLLEEAVRDPPIQDNPRPEQMTLEGAGEKAGGEKVGDGQASSVLGPAGPTRVGAVPGVSGEAPNRNVERQPSGSGHHNYGNNGYDNYVGGHRGGYYDGYYDDGYYDNGYYYRGYYDNGYYDDGYYDGGCYDNGNYGDGYQGGGYRGGGYRGDFGSGDHRGGGYRRG